VPHLMSLRTLAVCTLVGGLFAEDAWAQTQPPCSGTRFVVVQDALPGVQGASTVETIILGDASVEIPGQCPQIPAKIKRKTNGTTRIRAAWHRKTACAGGTGKVTLKGTVTSGCARIEGVLKNRNALPRKRVFAAGRSRCGDALIDAGAGEWCDPPGEQSQCPAGSVCTSSCACETVSTLAEARCGNGVVDGDEECDGGACCTARCEFASAATVCRPASGVCDREERCEGTSGLCPVDVVAPGGAECRASAGECDPAERCTGTSPTCPGDAKSTALCRPAVGPCDAAESCDGVSTACPPDALRPVEHVCRPAAGDCDTPELCDGIGALCPVDAVAASGTQCRPSGGTCDVGEVCNGLDHACPPDTLQPAGTVCRAASAECNLAESCTGTSPTCPGDAKSTALCRPAAGPCDAAETCDGVSNACAPDVLRPVQHVCRPAAGDCDLPELCTGASPACPDDARRTGVCRPAAGDCDTPELCDGVGTDCPPDVPAADCGGRPNIIFIMADDHPWSVYGFMKTIQDSGTFPVPTQHPSYPPIDTPNLDRLAARGAVFPVAASAQSTCIPSYSSALTGLYPGGERGSNQEVHIPEYLADEGYISYGFGKLWFSYEAGGFTHGGIRDWDSPRVTIEPIWDFIDSRDDDGPPWFLWYAPRLPHRGYAEAEPWLHLFPQSMFAEQGSIARKHYANVMLLDFWIGTLLDGLEDRGLDENTLIVFMSDNGYLMRNSKNRQGENGVRTPILVSLPNRIPRNLVLPHMVHAVDILPTMMDYAGAAPPAGVDGTSMRSHIDDPSSPGRPYLFTRFADQVHYLRTRDGLRFGGPPAKLRLFDLTVDPDEDEDLANHADYQHRVPALVQALRDLDASVSGAGN